MSAAKKKTYIGGVFPGLTQLWIGVYDSRTVAIEEAREMLDERGGEVGLYDEDPRRGGTPFRVIRGSR